MQFIHSYWCEPEVYVIYSTREGLLLMGVVWAVYGVLYVQGTLHLRQIYYVVLLKAVKS